ncbi:SRPBCC family protein [Cellulophaga sp. Z1A5H]|uniref:SRPBCC family protein n=1 Tax=Cellulophaga sp. Z1A5H TaxID=2687291 RepID=UPI0013FE3677|nr:SRPBCC family protein [Cellulophaga sp. Z1A5H]
MRLYRLHSKQQLPIAKEKAWSFLSDPANLKVITPEAMGFEILSGADKEMYAGQIIQYNVSPIAGIKTRWVTEITHVDQGNYFVDEQRFGPYALWHHKHFIHPTENGVVMEDIIDYKIPFGLLGQFALGLFIKKQLATIFKYREEKLIELFGQVDGKPSLLEIKKI